MIIKVEELQCPNMNEFRSNTTARKAKMVDEIDVEDF
jgi:hypothetical protein